MKISINVKRTFKINGKEYSSIDEVPDALRETFKKAMESHGGSGLHTDSAAMRTKIVFNGMEYESMDAMPQDVRRLYEKILKATETGSSAPEIDLADIGGSLPEKTEVSGGAPLDALPQPPRFEPAFSPRMLLVIFMLGGLLLLIYYLWQSR